MKGKFDRGWDRGWISTPLHQRGKLGYILAWLIGVPVPILVLIYLLRGCT